MLTKRPCNDEQKAQLTFAAIVSELEIVNAEIALSEERFEFWAKQLWLKHPRITSERLYDRLGQLAFNMARQGSLGSLQLFALATLGLNAAEASRRCGAEAFFESEASQRVRAMAEAMAGSTMMPRAVMQRSHVHRSPSQDSNKTVKTNFPQQPAPKGTNIASCRVRPQHEPLRRSISRF